MSVADFHVLNDAVVNEFAAALGRLDAVVTDAATPTAEGHDYWGFGGTPGLLVRPHTREEVVAVVGIAAEHHIPVVTRGEASNCAAAMMPNAHCLAWRSHYPMVKPWPDSAAKT